ncbi:MAG: DEAD/DEAH box helicase [Ilumatobacteraceae bacterium]|jgi:superfamily II DNA/RNA helicase
MSENNRPSGGRRRRSGGPRKHDSQHSAVDAKVSQATFHLTMDDYVPTGFAQLGVPAQVDLGLQAAGFAEPFAIQVKAIPVALTGRDVCGRAKTGSGKTLAFGVPMLARLQGEGEPYRPRGLVLVPTRELALQVSEVLAPVALASGHSVLAVYGGASRQQQIDALKIGVDVVVATPLRLIDLLKENELQLDAVEIVVLDEADRMADDGFTPQVEWILRKVTGEHQTMLFSATLDGDVAHLVARYMREPEEVAIDAVTDTVGTMHHLWLAVHHMDKDRVVASIASSFAKTIVFCQTKRVCDRVERNLQDIGVRAAAIHGDLSQASREKALRRFTEGDLNVLVATDVAARGIDIDDIGAVIHYEPAGDVKDYLHRSGRTARAGRDGWAVTLAEYNQHTQVRILQRALRLEPNPPVEVFSNNPKLRHLADFELD